MFSNFFGGRAAGEAAKAVNNNLNDDVVLLIRHPIDSLRLLLSDTVRKIENLNKSLKRVGERQSQGFSFDSNRWGAVLKTLDEDIKPSAKEWEQFSSFIETTLKKAELGSQMTAERKMKANLSEAISEKEFEESMDVSGGKKRKLGNNDVE
jgi:hypothetical protein